MAHLTKQNAKSVGDLRFKEIPVPEWGEDVSTDGEGKEQRSPLMVRIRSMPQSLSAQVLSIPKEEQAAWLIAQSVVDADGSLIYEWPDDKEFLQTRDTAGSQRITSAATDLASISEDRVKEAGKN